MRTKAIQASLLAWGAVSLLHADNPLASRQAFEQVYTLIPGGSVTIDNPYGDVRITGWDRDEVRIQAIKHAADAGRLEDAQIVVESTTGRLTVRTQYAGERQEPASVEYQLTVPRTAHLEDIRLVNGTLSLSGLTGPVKATAVNGNIKAEGLAGRADLATINGQVDAGFERISGSQPISLRSVNGPIVLTIPSGSSAQLIAQNRSGGIESDLGRRAGANATRHRFQAVVGGGGASITLRNVNGGISIHSTWSRRHERPGL